MSLSNRHWRGGFQKEKVASGEHRTGRGKSKMGRIFFLFRDFVEMLVAIKSNKERGVSHEGNSWTTISWFHSRWIFCLLRTVPNTRPFHPDSFGAETTNGYLRQRGFIQKSESLSRRGRHEEDKVRGPKRKKMAKTLMVTEACTRGLSEGAPEKKAGSSCIECSLPKMMSGRPWRCSWPWDRETGFY